MEGQSAHAKLRHSIVLCRCRRICRQSDKQCVIPSHSTNATYNLKLVRNQSWHLRRASSIHLIHSSLCKPFGACTLRSVPPCANTSMRSSLPLRTSSSPSGMGCRPREATLAVQSPTRSRCADSQSYTHRTHPEQVWSISQKSVLSWIGSSR